MIRPPSHGRVSREGISLTLGTDSRVALRSDDTEAVWGRGIECALIWRFVHLPTGAWRRGRPSCVPRFGASWTETLPEKRRWLNRQFVPAGLPYIQIWLPRHAPIPISIDEAAPGATNPATRRTSWISSIQGVWQRFETKWAIGCGSPRCHGSEGEARPECRSIADGREWGRRTTQSPSVNI